MVRVNHIDLVAGAIRFDAATAARFFEAVESLRFDADARAKLTGRAGQAATAAREDVQEATANAVLSTVTSQGRGYRYLKAFRTFADAYTDGSAPDAKAFAAAMDAFGTIMAQQARAALVVQLRLDPTSEEAKRPQGWGGVKSTIAKAKAIAKATGDVLTVEEVNACIESGGVGFDALYERCPKRQTTRPTRVDLTEATPAQMASAVASAPAPHTYVRQILGELLQNPDTQADVLVAILSSLSSLRTHDVVVAFAQDVMRSVAEQDAAEQVAAEQAAAEQAAKAAKHTAEKERRRKKREKDAGIVGVL